MSQPLIRRSLPHLIPSFVALLLVLWYLFQASTVAPLGELNTEDGYIHAAIAQTLAHSGRLAIQPDAAGGGSSSTLWTLLLTLGTIIGLPTHIAGLALGIVCWVVTGFLISAWLAPHVGKAHALVLSILVALSGQLTAIALSGMETSLAQMLTILFFVAVDRQKRLLSFILLALAVLTRPEMILLGFAYAGDRLIFREDRSQSYKDAILHAGIVVSALLISLLLLRLLSGEMPQTLGARRWLTGLPEHVWQSPMHSIAMAMSALKLIWIRLADYVGPGHGLGLLWAFSFGVFFITGVYKSLRTPGSIRAAALFTILVGIFYLVLLPNPGQLGRYAWPLWSLGLIIAGEGFRWLSGFTGRKTIPIVVAVVLGLSYIPQTLYWAGWHRGAVFHLHHNHMAIVNSLNARLSQDDVVAAFDIGLIAYRAHFHVVDIGGVTDSDALHSIYAGSIASYLDKKHVGYIALPEYTGSRRFILANKMGLPLDRLGSVMVQRGLNPDQLDHFMPTLIAFPVLSVYPWLAKQ